MEERGTAELRKLLDSKPDFTPTEWEAAGKVVDAIKDIEKSIKDYLTAEAMEADYGDPWEENEDKITSYYPRYTHMKKHMDSVIKNLHNLMENASSESERMMYQRFIDEAEKEHYGR